MIFAMKFPFCSRSMTSMVSFTVEISQDASGSQRTRSLKKGSNVGGNGMSASSFESVSDALRLELSHGE